MSMEDPHGIAEEYTRPDGVEVEVWNDGTRRFTGKGGGVLFVFHNDDGKPVAETSIGGSGGLDQVDALFIARDKLLEATGADGMPLFPGGQMNVSNPEVWREVFNYKGELESLITALLQRKAQFFRDIADGWTPGKANAEKAEDIRRRREIADGAVETSIATAARLADDLPTFSQALRVYRELRDHAKAESDICEFGKATAGETSSNFRKKLVRLGFGWIPGGK